MTPEHRGRFAPSPTGPLHFGSLIAAMASHADARAAGGAWLVRIEDVDVPRTVRGAEERILRDLERHGFAWDGAVERQSQRTGRYQAAVESLAAAGLVYECACTRRELAAAPQRAGEPVYPGTCAHGIPAAHVRRAQRSLRLRVPRETIEFVDRVQGRQQQVLARDVGDFVLRRADGWFAYQLAVVVDDGEQRVTSVVRGADLLDSTPRQIFLQRLLGVPTPRYLHVPVVRNVAGEKLSKQTGALAVRPGDEAGAVAALRAAAGFLRLDVPPVDSLAAFWRLAVPAWRAMVAF